MRSQSRSPARVGIDGVCGAGKSTFADQLAECIAALGRTVVRLDSAASIMFGQSDTGKAKSRQEAPTKDGSQAKHWLLARHMPQLRPDGARVVLDLIGSGAFTESTA